MSESEHIQPSGNSVIPDWLQVYLQPRVLAVLFLGFASGLPILLVLSTLGVWLRELEVDKSTIGLFAFVFTPYLFKFAWAPLIQTFNIPVLTSLVGRRRAWLLVIQVCLIAAIYMLGQTSPAEDLYWTAVAALCVSFFSASQDIVIDGFRIDILNEGQQGAGAANVVTGYRIGMWAASAGALYIAHLYGWSMAYTGMAALIIIGMVTVIMVPEPDVEALAVSSTSVHRDRSSNQVRYFLIAAGFAGFIGYNIYSRYGLEWALIWAVPIALLMLAIFYMLGDQKRVDEGLVQPFADFFERNGMGVAILILAFVSLYKMSDLMIAQMASPFYVDIGFEKDQIAWVSGTFGFFVTFVGSYLIGSIIYKIGIMRGLWIAGILIALSNIMYAIQSMAGDNYALFHVTIFIENLSGGMGTTAFVAYLASLCNLRFTAVQYALLTSFMQMFGKLAVVPYTGFMVEAWGYTNFFLFSAAAGIPALILLFIMQRMNIRPPEVSVFGKTE